MARYRSPTLWEIPLKRDWPRESEPRYGGVPIVERITRHLVVVVHDAPGRHTLGTARAIVESHNKALRAQLAAAKKARDAKEA